MQTATLNNGVEMPILGFGVYQIPAHETEKAVSEALGAGYRHIPNTTPSTTVTAQASWGSRHPAGCSRCDYPLIKAIQ